MAGRQSRRKQLDIFWALPAKPRVKRMSVVDAGDAPGGGIIVQCECRHCGHKTGWIRVGSFSEAKRGVPCPKCNGAPA
jgi:hypothetical protein